MPRLSSLYASAVSMLLLAAACNSIFGVSGLEFSDPAGGAPGSTSSSASSGAGGAGGLGGGSGGSNPLASSSSSGAGSSLGAPCSQSAECGSGQCIDGFCCDTVCVGLCDACAVALGATANGTCTAAAIKSAPRPGYCDDTHGLCGSPKNPGAKCACSPSGECKVITGHPCSAGSDCASTFCADGLCCNTACATACSTCKPVGNCSTVTDAPNPGKCALNSVAGQCQAAPCICNGGGICKGNTGAPCMLNTQCASGSCDNNMQCT